MRRWILAILVLLIALAAAFFLLAPRMIERGTNKIDAQLLLVVSDHAKALPKTLTIVDIHSDSLLCSRTSLDSAPCGHMARPRARKLRSQGKSVQGGVGKEGTAN